MKFMKNRKFNPSSSSGVINQYEFRLVLSKEEQKELFPNGRMRDDITEWLTDTIGEGFRPYPERTWAASSLTNPSFYFIEKDDAMHFKMVWD